MVDYFLYVSLSSSILSGTCTFLPFKEILILAVSTIQFNEIIEKQTYLNEFHMYM